MAQNAPGRANSALTGGFAPVPAATAVHPTLPDSNRALSDSERAEIYKRVQRLNVRAQQLGHAPEDLVAIQKKYEQFQSRSVNAKLRPTDRDHAGGQTTDYGKIMGVAKLQVRQYDEIRTLSAQLADQLKLDEERKWRELRNARPTVPRRYLRSPKALSYDPNLYKPEKPMRPADRSAYESRLNQWKERVKLLAARKPEESIKRAEYIKLDLANHLSSPVLKPETRIMLNEQINQQDENDEQRQAMANALWDARHNVYEMENRLRRDTEAGLRQQAGGIFSAVNNR